MIPPVTEAYVRGLVEVGAEITGVNPDDVFSPCRGQDVWLVRAAVSSVLRERGWVQERIGEALHRDHSTISHHWSLHERRMAVDGEYRYLVERLRIASHYERPAEHRLVLTIAAQVAELDRAIATAVELRAELCSRIARYGADGAETLAVLRQMIAP